MDDFEAAFKAELAIAAPEAQLRHERKTSAAGMAPMALIGGLDMGAFCTQWPKIRTFVNFALSTLGWLSPGPAAAVRGFIRAFEATILPAVCPVKTP